MSFLDFYRLASSVIQGNSEFTLVCFRKSNQSSDYKDTFTSHSSSFVRKGSFLQSQSPEEPYNLEKWIIVIVW